MQYLIIERRVALDHSRFFCDGDVRYNSQLYQLEASVMQVSSRKDVADAGYSRF